MRCLTRRPSSLRGRVAPSTEIVRGDLLDPDSLEAAFDGVDASYYLVHSLGATGSFAEDERRCAEAFAAAARNADVERIVYLGGIARGDRLSEHLESRRAVGETLRASGVPTIEFRASIVIGEGSASFELIRTLVDALAAMVVPSGSTTGGSRSRSTTSSPTSSPRSSSSSAAASSSRSAAPTASPTARCCRSTRSCPRDGSRS